MKYERTLPPYLMTVIQKFRLFFHLLVSLKNYIIVNLANISENWLKVSSSYVAENSQTASHNAASNDVMDLLWFE